MLSIAVLLGAMSAPALADGLSYDDPGMHFQAPDGWTRLQLANPDDGSDQNKDSDVPVAVFTWHQGKGDQRTITITIAPFDGGLDQFEKGHESDLHSQSDSAFVQKKTKTALANGMPAYFLTTSLGSSSSATFTQRDEYLVIDTQRSIDVAYSGVAGQFDEQVAKEALASLYVVVYPEKHDS
jgi:uncharacterized protein GlcG (DUF336 family)